METIIKLVDVCKRYDGQTVLKNLNLEIEKWSMTALTGESGSGKTTILNIIGLLEKADGGKVIIGDENVEDGNTGQRTRMLRKRINYLFQNFALVDNETVDYNLDIGLRYVEEGQKKKQELKREILLKVGLEGFGQKKIFQLSGGEQQRVAVARALLKPCEIVLADEPTGSLDDRNAEIIMGFLKEMKEEGKTVLLVTHNLKIADRCDHVIRLDRA